ncbi:MAG: glycosyltransferase family 39 protein [Acidobacteria bacterium]|nr:glycosyltransferase family 39 protein [Acidobacteriota bacterium]
MVCDVSPRTLAVFILLAALLIATRACHVGILWADDNLPLAAAAQLAQGKTLYREVWFDKPPLVAGAYLLWGARSGWPLRMAGALYVLLVAWLGYRCARVKWGEREGIAAAGFLAFFLTFGLPSAVLPLAADMLLIAPHLAAVYFAWRGRAFWCGVSAGVGLLVNSKAVFVLAACALWQWRGAGRWPARPQAKPPAPLAVIAAGFALPSVLAAGWMAFQGSLAEYYRQVWQWGAIYAASTFVDRPVAEGITRTINWAGFHAALVVGAAALLWRERGERWRWAAWMALALAGITMGWRFFPRYYFLLLVPAALGAARGWTLLARRRTALAALALLLTVPLVRFGPRYVLLARGDAEWSDTAMDRDSRATAARIAALAQPGDTLFVWGFRPEIFAHTRLPAATRFLESQPLSGVFADRHLARADAVAPEFVQPQREELLRSQPTFVVDGLGPYNSRLALRAEDDLRQWLTGYAEAARTEFTIIYRKPR